MDRADDIVEFENVTIIIRLLRLADIGGCKEQPILFYHVRNRLAQRLDVLLGDPGHVDPSRPDNVDRAFLLSGVDLLRR